LSTAAFLDVVRPDLERVEATLHSVVNVEFPLLANILNDLFSRGGKRLRPAMVFLAAGFGESDSSKLTALATAVEMTHTATLVHDDLIDNSLLRRGSPTVNTLWHGGIVVLVGDYLFAKAAELAAEVELVAIGKLFAQTLEIITDGELRQAFTARSVQAGEEHYYRWIYAKTASLFAASAEAGAIMSHQTPEAQASLREYGKNLGMAFQVVDDILDFVGDESELGKPVGNDLRQGTVTLPTIFYLQEHPGDEDVQHVLNGTAQDENHVARVIQAIHDSPAISRSYDHARAFVAAACGALDAFPDNEYRRAMIALAESSVERKK
jgi:geranylgeranyl pyrophosphate synthase